ncbi:MAG: hypothetical protein P0S95_00910 [Rhabdochlamydiaceae bacterium]|nr:hypothetical protein [Candidatus Amphrikana amoebophyrae]
MKLIFKLLGSFLALAIIIVSILPMLFSSNWGQNQLASILSMSTKSTVKIENVRLGWFGNQSIRNLSVSTPDYQIHVKSINLDNSLWGFVFSGFSFTNLNIDTPQCRIFKIENSPTNSSSNSSIPFLFIKKLNLKNGTFSLSSKNKQLIQFNDIHVNAKIERSKKTMDVEAASSTNYNNQSGKIDLKAHVNVSEAFPFFQLNSNIIDLPLEGLDQIALFAKLYDKPVLSQSFGSTMNIRLHLDSVTNNLEAVVKSKHLNLNLNTNNKSAPLIFDWTVNPQLLSLFNIDQIKKPFSLSSQVHSLQLPSIKNWKQSAFKLKTVVSQLEINSLLLDRTEIHLQSENLEKQLKAKCATAFTSPLFNGVVELDGLINSILSNTPKLKLILTSNSLQIKEPITNLTRTINHAKCIIDNLKNNEISATVAIEDVSGPSLLGSNCNAKFIANYKVDQNLFQINNFDLSLNSSMMQGNFQGSFDLLKQELILSKDGYIDYKLAPSAFKLLITKIPFPIILKKETSVSLILEKSSSINQIEANLFSEDFTVTLANPHQDFEFRNFDTHVKLNPKSEKLNLTSHMNIKDTGKVILKADQNFQLDTLKVKLEGSSIPSNLFAPWLKINAPLSELIGDNLDFKIEGKQENGHIESIDLDMKAHHLSFKGAFELDEEGSIKEITTPLNVKYTMTPQAYTILSVLTKGENKTLFQLKQPAKLSFHLPKFSIDPKQGFSSAEFKGLIELQDAIVTNDDFEASVSNLKCDLKKKKEKNAIATIASSIISDGSNSQIEGAVEIKNVNISLPILQMLGAMQLDSHLSVSKLPTKLLDALSQPFVAFPFSGVLGANLNANIDIQMQNDIKKLDLSVDATDADLSLKGTALPDKFLLDTPIEGSLKLTTSLSHILFDNLGFSIRKSQLPITLDISDRGFILPLTQNGLDKLQIGLAILNPGQIVAVNKGTLSGINSIFKIQGTNTMQLWFAPFYTSFHQGVLNIQRTEILVDRALHICIWGEIDYLRKYVNLTIGLTAQALRKTLNVSGIPDSYVLQVPLTGPFDNVKLQKGAITAKMALLLGGQAAPTNSIFGAAVSVFNSLMNDQSKVPPPKRPYPWERKTSMSENKSTHPILKLKEDKKRDEELIHSSIPIDTFLPIKQE